MYQSHSRTVALLALGVLVFCLSASNFSQAGIVPWMSGYFYAPVLDPFTTGYWNSPDGTLGFQLSFSPVVGDLTWTYSCDPSSSYCPSRGDGLGPVAGGDVTGGLYHFDGKSYILEATYTGSIIGGSAEEQWWYDNGSKRYYNQYWYDFSGSWTNGWVTVGSGYSSEYSEAYFGYFNLMTTTPEPSTLLTLSTGLLGLAGLASKRMFR